MGLAEFNKYYSEIYGARWPDLLNSLMNESLIQFPLGAKNTPIRQLPAHQSGLVIPRSPQGQLQYYVLDPASVAVARALPLRAGSKNLDMCAAPGGKSLVLISRLEIDSQLICNELSLSRREALKKVIQNYLPLSERENRIWVKGQDGVQFGLKQPEEYDSILLDAPCSGEAHLLENATEMASWTQKRSQGLSIKQYSLLSSAWMALKPGGYLLYSTCSISPLENDQVVSKLLKRKGDEVRLISPELEIEPEWTAHGFQYFPDKTGMGPMYASLIQKKE